MPINLEYNYASTNDQLHQYPMIDNYIYLYHIDKFLVLPTYAEQLQDSISITFSHETPLGRSAPIYSFSNSGPRKIQFSFKLHRDLFYTLNYKVSNLNLEMNDDYVDIFIRLIQAAALPSYSTATKMVNPPMVAVRLGDEIFIKGIIDNYVGVTYGLPILRTNKYANVEVNFGVSEIEPFDAESVVNYGSFRGLNETLEGPVWRQRGWTA